MKTIYCLLIAFALVAIGSQNASAQMAPSPGGGGALYAQPQISPNPAHDLVKIQWQQAQDGGVRIELYRVDGSLAAVLVNQYYNHGSHVVTCNVSGFERKIHFLKMQMPGQTWSQKLVLQ